MAKHPLKVLVACESSGRVRDAFIRAGCMAMSCDLLPTEQPGPHYQGDVRDVLDGNWDLLIAHPACTRLTNSGVRWLVKPPKKLAPWQYPAEVVTAFAGMGEKERLEFMWDELHRGAEFYRLFQRAKARIGKAIENPVMHCHARELLQPGPRQIVQPWWFGEPFFKATGFELDGLPPLEPTSILAPPPKGSAEYRAWSAVHMASPGPNRWRDRSRTYQGIADAMAAQWGQLVPVRRPVQLDLLAA